MKIAGGSQVSVKLALALAFASTLLILGLCALSFILGYAKGSSKTGGEAVSAQNAAPAAPAARDAHLPNASANLPAESLEPEFEEASPIWFDAKNEAHLKHVKTFAKSMARTIENYRPPESMTQELVDFLDFEKLSKPDIFFSDNSFSIYYQLLRYRLRFCEEGDFIKRKYGEMAHWSIVASRCLSPDYGYRGTSPAFSLYWSNFGCEDRDYEFAEYFSATMCIKLQEIQFERIEALRRFLSNPDRLRHIFVLKRASLGAFLQNLDAKSKAEIRDRLLSAIKSAGVVLANCKAALCAISEPDYSISKDPWDTKHFVSVSPIKKLIDYDMLLASEIYEIEFFVRRYNEGGRPLVAAYIEIMQQVVDMAAEPPK